MTPSVEKILSDLVDAANGHSGEEFTPELRDAINALVESEHGNISKTVSELLTTITSPTGAGLLAVWLGAAVEDGGDPALSARGVASAMTKWSNTIVTQSEETDEEEAEPDEEVLSGMALLGRALVAHLSRSETMLGELSQEPELRRQLERIEPMSIGAMWVMQIFHQQSGSLVVLDVKQQRGSKVEYENISNCFHLFTLLQGALAAWLPGAQQTHESVLAVARGESSGEANDEARWHFGQPSHVTADLQGMVFGEATPDSIETIGNQQVLLLWPNVLQSRGWDAGFFSPIIETRRPRVRLVKMMSPEEFHQWAEQLHLPEKVSPTASPQSEKPWWKPW